MTHPCQARPGPASLCDTLRRLRACSDAVEWAGDYSTLPAAWSVCQRGDWMLWLAAKAGLCTRQQLVLAACECARLALPHVPAGEDRPRLAIETAERWARGGATRAEARAAAAADAVADAAYAAAAAAAAADAVADAAYAAAAAADAAYAASYVADDAYAAYVAAYAAAYAAYAAADAADAARTKGLAVCADIVRRRALAEGWRIA